jgi:hypothetical protein
MQNYAAVGCEEISKLLGSAVKLIKTALKARYAARRPSTENVPYDLFNPARIHQWGAAILRVRAAYTHGHNGRKPRLLRPRRFTEKMQWRKLFDLNPLYAVISDKLAVRDFIAERVGNDLLLICFGLEMIPPPFPSMRSIRRTSSREHMPPGTF